MHSINESLQQNCIGHPSPVWRGVSITQNLERKYLIWSHSLKESNQMNLGENPKPRVNYNSLKLMEKQH